MPHGHISMPSEGEEVLRSFTEVKEAISCFINTPLEIKVLHSKLKFKLKNVNVIYYTEFKYRGHSGDISQSQ